MTMRFTRVATKAVLASSLLFATGSCSLDRDPPLNELTTEQVYRDPSNYPRIMAKLYASLILTGQSGAGVPDITAGDEGYTSFYRSYWNLQETGSDLIANAWFNDPGIPELAQTQWSASHPIVQAMFTRIYYEINLCNEYLRQTTDSKLSDYGISGADAERAREYRNDARFLRAMAYFHAVDMFGAAPFVTEEDPIGYFFPKQVSRQELFNYVESELKAVETTLPAPSAAQLPQYYGRATQAAAQTILARLYLNAQVYTGQARYTDCITYANKVMQSGNYQLADNYMNLFAGDNGQNPNVRREIIFSLNCDGAQSQTYGGTTVIINGSMGSSFASTNKSTKNAWGGQRAKPELVRLWGDSATIVSGSITDQRAGFYSHPNTAAVRGSFGIRTLAQLRTFQNGFAIRKWTNTRSDGLPNSDATGGLWSDTDVPFLRLGEVYLTYAEAVVRGGAGGDRSTALARINDLRVRANAAPITDAELTEQFLLDERGRELYWEGYRRTDLVRFGKFSSGSYVWTFKNAVPTGAALPAGRDIFPIPASAVAANPGLTQNPGY